MSGARLMGSTWTLGMATLLHEAAELPSRCCCCCMPGSGFGRSWPTRTASWPFEDVEGPEEGRGAWVDVDATDAGIDDDDDGRAGAGASPGPWAAVEEVVVPALEVFAGSETTAVDTEGGVDVAASGAAAAADDGDEPRGRAAAAPSSGAWTCPWTCWGDVVAALGLKLLSGAPDLLASCGWLGFASVLPACCLTWLASLPLLSDAPELCTPPSSFAFAFVGSRLAAAVAACAEWLARTRALRRPCPAAPAPA